jgi:hypothetical protein
VRVLLSAAIESIPTFHGLWTTDVVETTKLLFVCLFIYLFSPVLSLRVTSDRPVVRAVKGIKKDVGPKHCRESKRETFKQLRGWERT